MFSNAIWNLTKMRTLHGIEKLRKLLKQLMFSASEARSVGIHPSLLAYYVKKGLIERIERGFYRGSGAVTDIDFQWEDLVLASKSIPEGIVCLISALAIYEMTDEIPRQHWIAVPNSSRAPKRKNVKILRMRNTELGQTVISIGNQKINIFDRERTIVDAFRYLGKEIAIKALKAGLAQKGEKKIRLTKLQDYARKLRFDIKPYVMAVTT